MVAGLKSCGLASFAFVGINAQETGPHIATQWTLVISPATRPCKHSKLFGNQTSRLPWIGCGDSLKTPM